MTPYFGPDEMRDIMLTILDVSVLMEALFVCQLHVTDERERIFSGHVDTSDKITYYIKHVFF